MRGVSFRGYNFESNGWYLITPPGFDDKQITGVYLGGGNSPPLFAGVNRSPRILPFILVPIAGTAGSFETRYRQLERDCLRSDLGNEAALVVEFNTGEQTTIQARFRSKRDRTPEMAYNLTFEASTEALLSVADSDTLTGPTLAGGSLTLSVTTSGTARTRPVIIAEYVKAKTNQPIFSQQYTITRTGSLTVDEYPYTLVFDHEALVNAGKSLASGLDILVFVDGAEVSRSLAGADTATASVTFPLTIESSSALVEIRYAAAGQTYGLGSYYKANHDVVVTNVLSTALADYPYAVTLDHAALVTAGTSAADGDDLRLFVNGIELDRAVANANTATTAVWFPLSLAADGVALVEVRSGWDDFAGTTYSNGSLSFSSSDNTNWVYATPLVDTTTLDTPGLIRAIAKQVNPTYSIAPGYSVATSTVGTDPSLLTTIVTTSSPGNGNYIRFYAGGVRLSSLKTAVRAQSTALDTLPRIADSSDGSAYTSRYTLPQASGSPVTTNYATYALSSAATHVIAGLDINDSILNAGSGNIAHWFGQGTDELTLVLNSDDVPTTASHTSLADTTGDELFTNTIDATLTDDLSHTLQIRGLSLTENQQLSIDAQRRRISILAADGTEVAGSAATARDKLTITSTDHDWLALEPDTTSTLTWTEDNLDADGLTLTAEVSDAWH